MALLELRSYYFCNPWRLVDLRWAVTGRLGLLLIRDSLASDLFEIESYVFLTYLLVHGHLKCRRKLQVILCWAKGSTDFLAVA